MTNATSSNNALFLVWVWDVPQAGPGLCFLYGCQVWERKDWELRLLQGAGVEVKVFKLPSGG